MKSFADEAWDDEFTQVVDTYGEDLDPFKLEGQLLLLPTTAESMRFDTYHLDVNDVVIFQSLDGYRKLLLSEVCTLGKVASGDASNNAVSERSFSALKRVKTYLRSTTGDSRLKHLMLLHVHKDRTDSISLMDAANQFVYIYKFEEFLISRF